MSRAEAGARRSVLSMAGRPPGRRMPAWRAAALTPPLLVLLPALLVGQPAAARSDPGIRRADAAALAAARRFLCPFGGTPVRGLRGRCRGGAPSGLAVAPLGDPAPGWWDGGLPPPSRRQLPCPPGTSAAAPVARTDSVRCVPE